MKLLIALFALVSFGIFVPNSYADDLTLNLGAIGLGNVDLGPVSAGTGVVTYDQLGVPILDPGPGIIAGVYNFNFTAAYADVGVFPTNVASELVVTESCVAVLVTLKGIDDDPCGGLSFAYSNTNVGNIVDIIGGVNIGADLNADALVADVGVGIGSGTETIGFGNPPPPSATPEPGTLSLMGTGLLGIAGVVRRKFRV